ncbi:UvrD-helicase domain-containing protein [Deefgea tanakiae]|uniref:UvrD-helicase domain-containing protein n=1 Tax=Deefgea tanakiae TaxID=2865840 RepID=A0ABX8ZA52_9NEIS|nr:UvrD-helicase domain-containing protein [Deefgea tanakiae]QZA78209.1 UvrD-helicase domain-containing protein [Deefgea tanakiae]
MTNDSKYKYINQSIVERTNWGRPEIRAAAIEKANQSLEYIQTHFSHRELENVNFLIPEHHILRLKDEIFDLFPSFASLYQQKIFIPPTLKWLLDKTTNPKSWRRLYRANVLQAVELAAQKAKQVGGDSGQSYASKAAIAHKKLQIDARRQFAKNRVLFDPKKAAKCVITQQKPDKKFAEWYCQLLAMKLLAEHQGLTCGGMITISLPPEYHSNPQNAKDDSSPVRWTSEYTIKQGAKLITDYFNAVKAALLKRKIKLLAVKVEEPQEDGTPHYHIVIWYKPEWFDDIKYQLVMNLPRLYGDRCKITGKGFSFKNNIGLVIATRSADIVQRNDSKLKYQINNRQGTVYGIHNDMPSQGYAFDLNKGGGGVRFDLGATPSGIIPPEQLSPISGIQSLISYLIKYISKGLPKSGELTEDVLAVMAHRSAHGLKAMQASGIPDGSLGIWDVALHTPDHILKTLEDRQTKNKQTEILINVIRHCKKLPSAWSNPNDEVQFHTRLFELWVWMLDNADTYKIEVLKDIQIDKSRSKTIGLMVYNAKTLDQLMHSSSAKIKVSQLQREMKSLHKKVLDWTEAKKDISSLQQELSKKRLQLNQRKHRLLVRKNKQKLAIATTVKTKFGDYQITTNNHRDGYMTYLEQLRTLATESDNQNKGGNVVSVLNEPNYTSVGQDSVLTINHTQSLIAHAVLGTCADSDLAQQVAIHAPIGKNHAIMAAAGSGKTYVLIQRVQIMMKAGVSASSILVTTYTNEAADELKKRLARFGITRVRVGTLHSIAGSLLTEHGSSKSVIGYDQLIEQAAKIAVPRFHILADEAQDLDANQWQLLQAMGMSIYAVGDTRQSIYGWRGANSAQFTDFLHSCGSDFFGTSGRIVMAHSRRSCAAIIGLANRLSEQYTPSVAIKQGGSVITKQCKNEASEHEQIFAFVKDSQGKSLVVTRSNTERLHIKKRLWSKGLLDKADVMTIHAAKGAEADNVVLRCGQRKRAEVDGLETTNEWYVRITRAKTNLLITAVGGLPVAISKAL